MSGEHLLITFMLSETLRERVQRDFGFESVEYYPPTYVEGSTHPDAQWNMEPPSVPADVLRKTTVLLTMFYIPPGPEASPNLRLVQPMCAGIDHLVPALQRFARGSHELLVTTSSGVHSTTIAEYVVMQSLNFSHRLGVLQDIQKNDRKWARTRYVRPGELGGCSELRDHTVGIVGYGCIGREVGRLCSAFGMDVIVATSQGLPCPAKGFTLPNTGDPEGKLPSKWYRSARGSAEFAEFLERCDYLVLSVPLTPATRGLVDAESLRQMRPHALLINISRGPLVDQDALIDALEAGGLGGACLDVTDPEPLPPGHRLWSTANVVVTPHIAGAGFMYATRCIDLLEANLEHFRQGQPLINATAIDKGY